MGPGPLSLPDLHHIHDAAPPTGTCVTSQKMDHDLRTVILAALPARYIYGCLAAWIA